MRNGWVVVIVVVIDGKKWYASVDKKRMNQLGHKMWRQRVEEKAAWAVLHIGLRFLYEVIGKIQFD